MKVLSRLLLVINMQIYDLTLVTQKTYNLTVKLFI